jgi:hypothetical protein
MKVERYSDTYKILEVLRYSTPKTASLISRKRFGKAVLKSGEYDEVLHELEILCDVGLLNRLRVQLTENKSELVYQITEFGLSTFQES